MRAYFLELNGYVAGRESGFGAAQLQEVGTHGAPSLPAGGQQARKVRQLVAVQIGDQADAHVFGGGALDVEAVARIRAVTWPASRPDEDIDQVLPALVDEDRDGMAADIVEPCAGELEPLLREIRNRRRERQPGAQPGLDRVLVRGRHVDEAGAPGGGGVAPPPFAA